MSKIKAEKLRLGVKQKKIPLCEKGFLTFCISGLQLGLRLKTIIFSRYKCYG